MFGNIAKNKRMTIWFLSAVALTLSFSPAWADHGGQEHFEVGLVVPASSSTGNYTVSWTDYGATIELEEKYGTDPAAYYSTVYTGSGTSVSFTGKPSGIYQYRIYYENCSYECYDYYSYQQAIFVGSAGISSAPTYQNPNAVGSTPYSIDVGVDGDADIQVPLQLIPGVAQFAPALGLHYDSGRGVDRIEQSLPEDTVGYGWRLTGLSQIRRCVVDHTSSASIQLTNSDSLCLDGIPLVPESGAHFSEGTIYRTKIESFIRVEIKETSGAMWFQATMPDGTVRQYGKDLGSRVANDGGVEYQWSINKSTSTDGNVIDYSYWLDAENGINYILNINYSDADVDFEYVTRTDTASISIGGAAQTQSVLLHTVRVSMNDTAVREYRLLAESVSGRNRLNKLQQCGYDESGSSLACLEALDFDWQTPASTMAGVEILVDAMTDGLGAVHQVEYGTITGSSHPFLFTERPFGNGTLPPSTQLLSGSGALRHVATKLRRDNGLGSFHDTSYAYQNKGVVSTKYWGFLGFYAQRIKDEQSGIVTYVQYRLDFPFFGQLARVHQLDGIFPTHSQTLSRIESDYEEHFIIHSASTTVLPVPDASISFIFEGTSQLGASKTTNAVTFSNGLISQVVTTTQTGTGVTEGSPGSTWGDIPTYTLSGLANTRESTVEFTNRTTSGQWLINFADAVTTESWSGAPSGTGIVQDIVLTPHASSMRVSNITAFPNAAYLTLSTSFAHDTSGRATSKTVTGDNVLSRTTTIPSFIEDRYPAQSTNAFGHTTTLGDYDSRFGTVKFKGDPNGRNTSWVREPFGGLTSTTNSDGVVTTISYNDCPSGCGVLVYGIAPSYYIQTDSIVTPIRNTYFDSLGRVIRTEVESFSGAAFSKQDVKYDGQGRVEKSSLPYFNGSPNDVVRTHDIRNRVTSISRPDGSSTTTGYTVSGSTVIETITDNVKYANGGNAGAQIKRNEYNVLGQLTKTTDGYGTSTDPSTEYTYDAIGNVLTVEVDGGAAGTTTTTFEYDAAGNQTKMIDPNSGTITNAYTGRGEVRMRTDNKGQESTFYYDKLGRLLNQVIKDASQQQIDSYHWQWDTIFGVGKIEARFNTTGFSEAYEYSIDSRLDEITTSLTPIGGSTSTNYTTTHTYDSYGRPANTTYPGGFILSRSYNAQGYLSQLKDGTTVIQEINDRDAYGNSIDESYGNGVDTLRTYDPETGRLTAVDTTNGGTIFQDNVYAWRSNGSLQYRTANPAVGLVTTRKESHIYDVLNRVETAKTYINGVNTRDLTFTYNDLGNVTAMTSNLSGDVDVTGYAYGAGSAGPHAVTSFTVDGVNRTLTYDDNGAVSLYDIAGTSDDKYIEYNPFNQPTKIVVGSSLTDTTPVAKDEFAYDINGQRYARKTEWREGSGTITEDVVYIGAVEIISDDEDPSIQTITKTQLSPNVMHVKTAGTISSEFFEYAHRDHLGSIEVVTDDNGNSLSQLAFEVFGSRKSKDWTANIASAELDLLLDLNSGDTRKARGFTRHEHLDRTGFVHMNGRVYDPVIGRFLSPDPIIPAPTYSQSWNRYSYVYNSPLSLVDPSGFDDRNPNVFDNDDRRDGRWEDQWLLNASFNSSQLPDFLKPYNYDADVHQCEFVECDQRDPAELGNSQTDQSSNAFVGLAEQIKNAPFPENSDLGSLGVEPPKSSSVSIANFQRRALTNPTIGGTLQSINKLDDIAIRAVGVQIVAVSIIGEVGGAALASETLRQWAIKTVASQELLMLDTLRLTHTVTGGQGLGFAMANSANTSIAPAWVLARGAAVVTAPTISLIVD